MSKQVPASYVVRHGDKAHAWRYRSRNFRDRKVRELGWTARAIVIAASLAIAIAGNVVPIVAVATNAYANFMLYAIVGVGAATQLGLLGWLWLRSAHTAWSKLMWSIKLAVPVLGMLFFAAFYSPPERHNDNVQNSLVSL